MKKKTKDVKKPKESIKELEKENKKLKSQNKMLKELLSSGSQESSVRRGSKIPRFSQEID